MLFLVTAQIIKSQYMSDANEYNVARLVDAETKIAACEKLQKYYENKTVDYSVYYHVRDISATGVII